MAGHKREVRLCPDDPAIHAKQKAGSDHGLFLIVIASEAKQSTSPVCRAIDCFASLAMTV
jgi:hypothetical protein